MARQVEAVGSQGYNRQPAWFYAGVTVMLVLFLLAYFPTLAQSRWPSSDNYGIPCILPALIGVHFMFRSAQSGIVGRITYGAMLIGTLFLVAVGFHMYFATWGDYPWFVGVPLTIGFVIGAWLAHQRWMSLAIPSFLVWWFLGVTAMPEQTTPTTQTFDGTTVTVKRVSRRSLLLEMTQDSGNSPKYLEVFAHIGTRIRLKHSRVHSRFEPTYEFSSMMRAPSWSKCVDLEVTVPTIPSKAQVSWEIDVSGDKPQLVKTNRSDDFVIRNPRWANEERSDLEFDIRRRSDVRLHYSDLYGRDEQGKLLKTGQDLSPSDSNTLSGRGKIHSIPTETKRIRVDYFSGTEWSDARQTFYFRRIKFDD